ncbi:hypothetical protein IE077_003103, partial [Cardiosporidium cionae]
DPGIFECLVTTPQSRCFFRIQVEVRRRIYVNYLTEWEKETTSHITVRKITKPTILPRNVKQYNLVELEMKESYFQDKKHTLSASFHRHVAGLYELQVPLEFDFLSRCGSIMEIHTADEKLALNSAGQFLSSALSNANVKRNPFIYLQNISQLYIHIFHGETVEGLNRIFVSIYEANASRGSILMFGGITALSIDYFDPVSLWNTIYPSSSSSSEEIIKKNSSMKAEEKINVEIPFPHNFSSFQAPRFFTDCQKVLREVEICISEYKTLQETGQAKYLINIFSTLPSSKLGSLLNDKHTAALFIPLSLKYSKIPRRNFAVDAFMASIELLVLHVEFFEERLALSRFSNLPVGYLLKLNKFQCYQTVFDVAYAQSLRQNHAILWATANLSCDLGHPSLMSTSYADLDLMLSRKSMLCCTPGIYRGFGAEIYFGETIKTIILIFNASRLSYLLNPEYMSVEEWSQNQKMLPSTLELLQPSKAKKFIQEENLEGINSLHCGFTHFTHFSPAAFRKKEQKEIQKILSQTLELLSRSLYQMHTKVTKSVLKELECISSHFSSWLSDSSSLLFDPALYRKVSEYVSMIQLDTQHYIRYRNYDIPTEENVKENLKLLDLRPYAVDAFLRQYLYAVGITPVTELLSEYYDELEEGSEPKALKMANLHELEKNISIIMKKRWFLPGSLFQNAVQMMQNPSLLIKKFVIDEPSQDSNPFDFPDVIGSALKTRENWKLEIAKFLVLLMQLDTSLEIQNSDEGADAFDEKRHQLFETAEESEHTPANIHFHSSL